MKRRNRIILLTVLFLILMLIRFIAQNYFYDPLIIYFKNDYLHGPIPQLDFGLYFLNLFYRFFLNTIVSLAIIYILFLNSRILKFSVFFYCIAFILFTALFFVLLQYNLTENNMFIFYVRRFLIHPLFLLILLPAFYYQQIQQRNKNK